MVSYIIRRLLMIIPVFLGTTFIIFAMVYGIGDPIAGRCGDRPCPDTYVARLRAEYHLDDPFIVQYFYYMGDLLTGNFGTMFNGDLVATRLAYAFPVTLKLALMAICIEAVVGIGAGIMAAIFKGRFIDHLVTLGTLLVLSIPVFVLGTQAQLILGIQLPRLLQSWGIDWVPFAVTATDGTFSQLILPAFVLAALSTAYVTRLTRSSLLDSFRSDYVRTARAKGLTEGRVVGVHSLRNSLIPVITYLGYDVGSLMGGAVVTERIFNVPGVGNFLFQSIQNKEGVAVVGVVTVLVLIYLLCNLLVDLLYGALDPRISND